ncbi:MAG: taurine dioxygenase [Parasphingorhabdus sp.]|jgi:taurine dioxygenase
MLQRNYKHITVSPASAAVGAEIGGIDLRQVNEDQFAEVKQAFADHGVIFFRDQSFTPEEHIQFAERWGDINVNRFFTPLADYPMIAEVRKEPEAKMNIGGGWHTDHSYDQIPALGSILYAREVPEIGGDTLFASMYLAYEGLSDGLKEMLHGLNAVHSSRHTFGAEAISKDASVAGRFQNAENATQDSIHPVIITHPLSGRKSLYINPDFTLHFEGWSREESLPLMNYLFEQASLPQNTCRFQWRNNTIAFWDNRATWHYALNDYHGKRRVMHRITIEGVELH